jgi:hypothetical protein
MCVDESLDSGPGRTRLSFQTFDLCLTADYPVVGRVDFIKHPLHLGEAFVNLLFHGRYLVGAHLFS